MTLTYTQLLNETIKIYLTGDYEKAYNYITKHSHRVNGNLAQIYNFRYAIASKAGLKDLALSLMKEAVLECGFWYATEYLMSDEDLDLLRSNKAFDQLVSICREREKKAKNNSEGKIELLATESLVKGDSTQLVIALHGNQENNEISKLYWNKVLNQKRIIALIQSSEIEFSDAYIWNDLSRGQRIIENFEESILKKLRANEEEIIFTGFSAGARQVLHYALFTNKVTKGLILIAPWLPELQEWEAKIEVLKNKKITVYIVCGDEDDDAFEDSKKLAQFLKKYQVKSYFHKIENLKHDYPNNFSEVIEKGIKFIES